MRKSKIIGVLILCFALLLTGCGNKQSREERKAEKAILKDYKIVSEQLIQDYLQDKYNETAKIKKLEILKSDTGLLGLKDGHYDTKATCKANIGDEEFYVYISWDELDNSIIKSCDNRERDKIIADLNKYFASIFGYEPYLYEYDLFEKVDGFNKGRGMLNLKYDGNIESFLKTRENARIIAIFDNMVTIQLTEENAAYQIFKGLGNVYLFNAWDNNFGLNELKNLQYQKQRDKLLPQLDEYLIFENDRSIYWKNNLIDETFFLYKGRKNEEFTHTILDYEKNFDLTIDMWKNHIHGKLSNYKISSNWHRVIEPDSTFYVPLSHLSDEGAKYYILTYYKNARDEYVCEMHEADVVMDYVVYTPKYKQEMWFAVCTKYEIDNIFDILI